MGKPDCIWPNVSDALEGIAASGYQPAAPFAVLQEALAYLQALQQVQRLAVGSETTVDAMPDGLKNRLCRAVGAEDFNALERHLAALKAKVHAIAVEKLQLPATD